jgi:O-antigen/teichoic acid export membrane protein
MAIIMGYIVRIVFTHVLSEQYVGVNGLFSDILNVLSLSEMGIETAVSFALYKPISEGNIKLQQSIMKLYKSFYHYVALFVGIAGLCVIPFMDLLIKNKPDIEHLTYIYLLYLLNTVLSYLFVYKRTLLDAHQLMYIGTLTKTASWVIQDIVQIVILLVTKNFILYLYVYILTTLISNIYISKKTDALFPFIKEKKCEPLSKEYKNGITKNIRAMMMHKIGDVIVNNTDNLLISVFVGITSVGCYSNYYLLIGSVQQVLNETFQGITASVGNLGATTDSSHVKNIFQAAFFLNNFLFGAAAICLFELLNPFVELSFGKQYLFSIDIVLILCVNFYVKGMTKSCLVFRNSLGLFWYDRYKSIIEAAINLVFSIILALKFGTAGVFLGTLISTVTTSLWVEPYVLYKYHFKSPLRQYFIALAKYFLETAFVWLSTHILCVTAANVLSLNWAVQILLVRTVICVVWILGVYLLINTKNEQFLFLYDKFKELTTQFYLKHKNGGNKI